MIYYGFVQNPIVQIEKERIGVFSIAIRQLSA